MEFLKRRAMRALAALASIVLLCNVAQAQNAEARGIVVDSNGKIYQANYLCDITPDCPGPLIKITNQTVKQGAAVAIGTIDPARPQNYVFIANSGKKDKILQLVEDMPGDTTWQHQTFDNEGATAMVITRNVGVLYVARDDSTVDVFLRDDPGIPGYNNTADHTFTVPYPGSGTCSDIVGIEEWPRNSGNLLLACNSPGGLVALDAPDDPTTIGAAHFSAVIPAGSLAAELASVGVSSVPVDTGFEPSGVRDFALVVANPSEVLAVDLVTKTVQRNMLIGGGQVRDLATGLCFRDPNNETDGDEDVDETCFSIVQSGNAGKTAYIEVSQAMAGSGLLSSNIVDTIDGALKNTYGVDLVNTGTENTDNCLFPETCQLANNAVTLNLENVIDEIISFETQGTFVDPRYNPGTGICDRDVDGTFIGARVALPLGFTGIPILKDASIGPEFCARKGKFFVDVLSAPDVKPESGFTKYETPGQCWMPGFGESMMGGAPETTLNDVEYGLLFGDQFDLLRNDGSDDPIGPFETYAGDYISNEFAQDNLVGCTNPRVRAGGRLTFVIEDFVGAELLEDLGMSKDDPIGDNVLFQYGIREGVQRIEIPVLSIQSGCYDDYSVGPVSSACDTHVTGMNAGLAGWDLQRLVGEDDVATGNDFEMAGLDGMSLGSLNLDSGLDGLRLDVAASVGDVFRFKTVDFSGSAENVFGLDAPTNGEIDIGQAITFTVFDKETPLTMDLDMALSGPLEVAVPFRVSQVTMALQFDGPEFGDVQEAVTFTAVLDDGTTWTATVTNIFEANGDPDEFGWEIDSDNMDRPAPSGDPVIGFLTGSGDDSGSEDAVFRVEDPFQGAAVVSLEIAAVEGDPACGSCNNQSDASIYDIGIEAVDRVQALSFAYTNYLRALCPVSTRPDFAGTVGMETRPHLCNVESIASEPLEFNDLATMGPVDVERNIAGYQQADLEGVLRFIAHNICELDYGTAANPGGVDLAPGGFCETVPEWAPTPSP